MIVVDAAGSVDDDLYAAVTALVPQLSSSSPPLTPALLVRVVEDPGHDPVPGS